MGTLEHLQRFNAERPKPLTDGMGERWKATKSGGAKRGFKGGWATVFKHRPTTDADKREGFDYCLMFVHEEPQRKFHGGTFSTLDEALTEASAAIKREQ